MEAPIQTENTDDMPRITHIPPEKKQQTIGELRLILCISRMEYQKILNLVDNEITQPSRFRT